MSEKFFLPPDPEDDPDQEEKKPKNFNLYIQQSVSNIKADNIAEITGGIMEGYWRCSGCDKVYSNETTTCTVCGMPKF